MIGKKFTRLTVINFSHKDIKSRKWWNCLCDCGTKKILHTGSLNSGNTKSCGCWKRDAKKLSRLPNDRGVINQIILSYKRHAKDRDIKFDLSFEEVKELLKKSCYYCGALGENIKITKNFKEGFRYNGIDRIINSSHYHKDNCVPCCGFCNRAKGKMDKDMFIKWALKVAKQWS